MMTINKKALIDHCVHTQWSSCCAFKQMIVSWYISYVTVGAAAEGLDGAAAEPGPDEARGAQELEELPLQVGDRL